VLIKHYLAAEYFAPLFFTDWITTFFREGFGAGIHNFFGTLYWMGKGFLADMIQGFRTGLAAGAFFGGYTVMMCILIGQSIADGVRLISLRNNDIKTQETQNTEPDNADLNRPVKKQDKGIGLKNIFIIEAHLALCFVGMLFALLLMYKLTEGSKHLLTFMAVGIFIISLMRTKTYKKAVVVGATFAYLFSYKAVDAYDYQIPFAEQDLQEQVENWRDIFNEKIIITEENTPNFDNTIIWTLADGVDGKNVNTKWQLLYALPEGIGISCCEYRYIADNFDSLQSRYIAVPSGGGLDIWCSDAGYEEIGRDNDITVYARY
jgi:hypothetical protein